MKNDNLDHENHPVRETSDALNLLRAVKLGEALRELRE